MAFKAFHRLSLTIVSSWPVPVPSVSELPLPFEVPLAAVELFPGFEIISLVGPPSVVVASLLFRLSFSVFGELHADELLADLFSVKLGNRSFSIVHGVVRNEGKHETIILLPEVDAGDGSDFFEELPEIGFFNLSEGVGTFSGKNVMYRVLEGGVESLNLR